MTTTAADIKSVLDSIFAFKPGDAVAHRETLKAELEAFGPRDKYASNRGAPLPIIISERVLKECHGGIQGFYQVHERDADRRGVIALVPDHAVVPYSEMIEALAMLAPVKSTKWADAVDGVANSLANAAAPTAG